MEETAKRGHRKKNNEERGKIENQKAKRGPDASHTPTCMLE
jgi:hypothetical protein